MGLQEALSAGRSVQSIELGRAKGQEEGICCGLEALGSWGCEVYVCLSGPSRNPSLSPEDSSGP